MRQPFEELERVWAEFNELEPDGMVVCSSGTAALHLAFEAPGLSAWGQVLVPDYTMIACPRAVVLAGLVPVLIDCNDTGLVDLSLLNDYGGRTIEGALLVHVYGRRCSSKSSTRTWIEYAVEDLAEAHGVKPWGSSDAACWSFYQNKIIAGQEGGAVWFKDTGLAQRARSLRSLGFNDRHDFWHIPRGHNYRMSNAHAELILQSIRDYPSNLERRWDCWRQLNEACPKEWRRPIPDAPWVYDIRIPGLSPHNQYAAVTALNETGIAARHPFRPCHQQPEFGRCRLISRYDRELWSTSLSRECLYLPLANPFPTSAFDILGEVLDG